MTYQFLIAVVTNYRERSGFEPHTCITVSEAGSQDGSQGDKIELLAGKNLFPLPAPTGCLHSLACGHITLTSASLITSSLALTLF